MATMTERLAFLISANADSAIRAFEKTSNSAEKELGKAEKKIDKVGGSLSKFGAGAMAFAGVAGAALMGFAREAEDAEQQSRKLGNSIENSGKFADGAQDRLEELAKKIQGITTADADAIIGMQALLTQFGLTEEEITKITPLVVDLSTKMNVDMNTAAKAVAKSATGSTTALKKMGIQVDKSAAGGDSFKATMDALAGTVGGFAEKEAETFSGKIEQLKVSLGDLQEGIGSGVIDVFGSAVGGLNNFSTALGNVDPDIQNSAGKIAGFATVAIGLAGSLSFVAGQTIKMRERFVDADGALNKMGQTAKITGKLLGGLAAIEVIGTIYNAIADSAGKVERSVQGTVIALGELEGGTASAEDVMDNFYDTVVDIQDSFNMSDIFKDFGKEIHIAGGAVERDIEHIDTAFTKLMDQSPVLAQNLLDTWRLQADALDHTSGRYEDNIMLINRYQERLDLATGSTAAIADASGVAADGLDEVGDAADDAAEATIDLTDAWEDLLGKFDRDEAVNNIKEKMIEADAAIKKAFSTGNQEDIDAAAQAVRDLYGDVADYIKKVGDIPEEKQTKILAMLDAGDYLGVLAMLNELERTRTANVNVVMNARGGVGEVPYGPAIPMNNRGGVGEAQYGPYIPGKALGGSISANQPYVVGELGPEIIVPNSSGTVIPNNKIGGTTSTVVNVNVTSSDPQEVVRALQRYVRLYGKLPTGIL